MKEPFSCFFLNYVRQMIDSWWHNYPILALISGSCLFKAISVIVSKKLNVMFNKGTCHLSDSQV